MAHTSRNKDKLLQRVRRIRGQLNAVERRLLTEAIIGAEEKPKVLIEVGTWYGGGSTLHMPGRLAWRLSDGLR